MAINVASLNLDTTKTTKTAAKEERTPAQFWLNVGYRQTVIQEDGTEEERFVAFPAGMALDTMEKVKINTRNETEHAFRTARNDLLEQVLESCKNFEPGEERIYSGIGPFEIQVRRVKDELPAIEKSANPFRRQLNLVV